MRNHRFSRIVAALAVLGCLMSGCGGEKEPLPTETLPPETRPVMSAGELQKAAAGLVEKMEEAAASLKAEDAAGARQLLEGIAEETAVLEEELAAALESAGDKSAEEALRNIGGLLELSELSATKILVPLADFVEAHPAAKTVEPEINMAPVWDFVDFLEAKMPELTALVQQGAALDLTTLDDSGWLAERLESLARLTEACAADSGIFQTLKNMLGAGGDRLYLVAPQNAADTRAAGGYTSIIGVIQIREGVMTLEDFSISSDVLTWSTPREAAVTTEEDQLFSNGLRTPRDATRCPDFERAGQALALGYEARQRTEVNGVISMTPGLVQQLLEITGEEIKLFDGNVLTSTGAAQTLQKDIYFQYFGDNYVVGREIFADQLLSNAGVKTFGMLADHMSGGKLLCYLELAEADFQNRSLMLWMKDEGDQNLVRQLGWNAGLSRDPEKPQAGIYFSFNRSCKLGWYLDLDAQMGQRVKNEDGSYTYPVTVTISNTMTEAELAAAGTYVAGNEGGRIVGTAYFFAPAGGSVSDFEVSMGKLLETAYGELRLGCLRNSKIPCGESLTVSYNVTTAPGAEQELTFSMTPTLQDYHE